VLLDSHIWFWLVTGDSRISARSLKKIEKASSRSELAISVISLWEIAYKATNGKIRLYQPIDVWIHNATLKAGIRVIDLSSAIAIEATQLPGSFHRDPADRFIVATARIENLILVSEDVAITEYGIDGHIRHISLD